ncbi:MAG: DNA polymerase III subunit beta, partial [Bacteroidota bacterium]
MKFSASSADLLDALNTVKGAVPSKSTLPILECILFEQSEDGSALLLSATDLEISIVRRVPVQFASNGTTTPTRVAVPAKRLIDTLRALPDLPISFTADGDFEIQLETDQGHYKMVGHDGDDFPDLPEVDAAHTLSAEGALISDAINKTSFAVSKDALRPAMMGIYFQLDAENSRIVATDGHRLVKLDRPALQTNSEEVSFIVPEKATKLVSRILDDDTLCTIGVSDGHVSF